MSDLYQSLVACHQRLSAVCEVPDFGKFYPRHPGGGVLRGVEEIVCEFAKQHVSFEAIQAAYIKLLLPLLNADVSAKLQSTAVMRDILLWLAVNRRYAMGVEYLIREINEQPEVRQWLVNHAGNLWAEKAQQEMTHENLEPLLDWFKLAREMEVALVMLWSDSMAAAASLRCPDSDEAKSALADLGEVLAQQAVHPASEALLESMAGENVMPPGVPFFFIDYETQEDFELIGEPEDGGSLAQYRRDQTAARQVLEGSGTKVIYMVIKTSGYLRWLAANDRKNNQRSRMRFACETWLKSSGVKL